MRCFGHDELSAIQTRNSHLHSVRCLGRFRVVFFLHTSVMAEQASEDEAHKDGLQPSLFASLTGDQSKVGVMTDPTTVCHLDVRDYPSLIHNLRLFTLLEQC